jgi:hypothetical protein
MTRSDADILSEKSDTLVAVLETAPTRAALDEASGLLDQLREVRDFDRLGLLAELTSRYRPNDLRVRRLIAQSLTEQGKPSVAADVATIALGKAEQSGDSEVDELSGVLGRACKQIFLDDPTSASGMVISEGARGAIEGAIAAYRGPWEDKQKRSTWHGVNLAAMLHVADARGLTLPAQPDKLQVASDLLAVLDTTPVTDRDTWWHATKAEAHVAREEWVEAETAISAYVQDDSISAFNFASTLRQFRDVWQVQDTGAEGLGLVQALEARYLERAGGSLERAGDKPGLVVGSSHLRTVLAGPPPDEDQLERILGSAGTQTIQWYRAGLERAASVAAVRKRLGTRIGTGFAVRSEDFGFDPGEVLLLTNFHVVNIEGAGIGCRPQEVEVVFEAEDPTLVAPFRVKEVIAQSPERGGLDYALLRFDRTADGVCGVPLASGLPPAHAKERVYVIGHAEGHELQFSLQDNWVLDHEGLPNGTPSRPERVRVHYFTPTAKGSSGSPVFDSTWDCIALHHAGAKHEPPPEDSGMRKLNGKSGYYSANEGISIESIRDHARTTTR